jgi:hypothetical protein
MADSIRADFVTYFGEHNAQCIEQAAEGHKNGIHDNPGSDPFKWAVLICIGYQCVENEDYNRYHGFYDLDMESFGSWCRRNALLHTHDGDVDYLSLFAGVYDYYMQERK